MPYDVKPLSCDPKKLTRLSEKLIVSHWENNYGGAVKRLNTITTQLSSLDFTMAPVFVINGLKREELIATNSMILHELYFDGLGDGGEPDAALRDALTPDHGLRRRGGEICRCVHGEHPLESRGRSVHRTAVGQVRSRESEGKSWSRYFNDHRRLLSAGQALVDVRRPRCA